VCFEPFSWQGVVHRLIVTDAPRPFPSVPEQYCVAVTDSQSLEIPHLGARQSPLSPEEGPQPPDQPAIELFEQLLAESFPEVVQPAGDHSVEITNDRRQKRT